jgi:hypothetical protein
MSDPKDVFSKLVVDEKETLKELERLVDAATKIFRIERPSGQVVFQDFGGQDADYRRPSTEHF